MPLRELDHGFAQQHMPDIRRAALTARPRSGAGGRADGRPCAPAAGTWATLAPPARQVALPVMPGDDRSSRHAGRTPHAGVDDAPLVNRARDGERAAFEELVRLHADRVYAVVIRFGAPRGEAEEIVQETFVRAWRVIGRFEGESQFFTWLYRIAINETKRHMTRRGARLERVASDEMALDAIGDPAPSPQLRAEHQDLRAALQRRSARCRWTTASRSCCAISRACRRGRRRL